MKYFVICQHDFAILGRYRKTMKKNKGGGLKILILIINNNIIVCQT